MRKIKLLFAAALSMIAWTGVMAQATEAEIAKIDAANAAIGVNNVYRIYTLSNGTETGTTKYYLKADGYLTDQVSEAKAFTFVLASGGSYAAGKGYKLNQYTNGGDGNNNITADAQKHIIVSGSYNRDDFEGQVFFLDGEGNYAIRSTNANSDAWAAAAFWTVVADNDEDGLPNATYTMDGPQYVWQLEKDETASQQLAAKATFEAWPEFIQSALGLVKDASKFYSNAKDPGEGSYEALVDGDYTTFFHSSYRDTAPDEDHYLQAELASASQTFEFYYKKRSQNNNNRPTKIVISASNDGTEFTEIKTIDSGLPTDAAVIDYMSGQIDLGAAYKYVRFAVSETNSGNAKNGHVFFTFSEFYIFPGMDGATELANFYNHCSSTNWTNLTESDIETIYSTDKTLKATISTINVTYELYEADGTTKVGSKEVVQKPYSDVEIPASLTADSKFYDYATEGTIGDTDCTIKVIRTLKAGFVGTLADLSNAKAYTITCDRGKFLTKNGYLASTAHNSLTSAEPSTFAIISYEDNYYLYSVADGKFVQNNGALADRPTNGEEDALVMVPKTVPYFLYKFNKRDAVLNTNGNDPYGYVINDWGDSKGGPDPGNQYYMVAEADFDPTAAITALNAQFHPAYAVVYVVKDAFGNTIFTSDPEPANEGDVVTTLPEKYHRTFYTYSEEDVTITETGETEVEFTAIWNGPFEISENFENAHWYDMAMRTKWYVTSAKQDGDGAYQTQMANTMGLVEDSYHWAFLGNGYEGFKVINKAAGEGMSFGWTDAQQTNAGIPTVMSDEEGHHFWNVVASTNTTVPANSFCLNVAGTNLYINQYGGVNESTGIGGSLKFWNSGNNVGDAGSAFTVFDIPTNFASYVIDEGIADAFETTGYFAFTDAAKAALGWNPAYKTDCPFEAYKSMKEKMAAAMEDVNNFVLPETGYYTLTNKLYDTFMGIDPSDANVYGNYKAANAAKQVVTLTKVGDATYTISLMGKYAPATVAQSAQVTAATDASTYTVVITKPGYAAFSPTPDQQYSYLHCASGGSVVGWESSADASQWAVAQATGIELTVGEAGYATAYLPFPVKLGQTISVPAAIGTWTFDNTEDLMAGTGIATMHATDDGVAAVEGGAIKVAKGAYLKMETGINTNELGTYSIMMDVNLPDDTDSRFSALFQNKPANDGDASFFIYNHKTNGRKVGVNAGGLGYVGSIDLNTWYRIVFSCENSIPTVYVNGVKVGAATSAVAEHWTLKNVVLFFTDNDGEENEILTDEIRFWDVALTEAEVGMLGAYGDEIPEPTTVTAYTAVIKDGAEGKTPGDYKYLELNPLEDAIPAYTAVILKGDAATYNFAIPAINEEGGDVPEGALPIFEEEIDSSKALVKSYTGPLYEENVLRGTLEPIDAAGKYVLAKPEGEEKAGFYLAESGKIAATKAYLELPGETEVKAFYFAGEGTTGIKTIDNGQQTTDGPIYNIAGQRLGKMQKGINIINGKKVLR